jgi:hypothetical protein
MVAARAPLGGEEPNSKESASTVPLGRATRSDGERAVRGPPGRSDAGSSGFRPCAGCRRRSGGIFRSRQSQRALPEAGPPNHGPSGARTHPPLPGSWSDGERGSGGAVRGNAAGGPSSPPLANVLLDDADQALERRGHHVVRYADDDDVYVRSRRAGERVMEVLVGLHAKLRLQISDRTYARASSGARFQTERGPECKAQGSITIDTSSCVPRTVPRHPIRRRVGNAVEQLVRPGREGDLGAHQHHAEVLPSRRASVAVGQLGREWCGREVQRTRRGWSKGTPPRNGLMRVVDRCRLARIFGTPCSERRGASRRLPTPSESGGSRGENTPTAESQ